MIRPLRNISRRPYPLLVLGAILVLTLSGCIGDGPFPQSTLDPKGDYAEMVDDLFMITVYLATGVFILVEGALLWAIFRYRGKPDDALPVQNHGNTAIEIVWTVIPALVLALVAVPTVKTILETAKVPATSPNGQPTLKVEVIGHQWWWEFRYPEYGIVTAGDMHVPLGRTVDLRMKTVDVVHSFWVPQFAGKRDVFPNRETRLWFTAKETGAFPGACAEFCGLQHARMDFYTVVSSPEDFAAWVAKHQADSTLNMFGLPKTPVTDSATLALVDPLVAEGERLFTAKGCMGCHSLSAMTPMKGMPGPNLAGIGSRTRIAGGWLENTDDNLHRWIKTPQLVKEGVLMVVPEMTDAEVDALVAYLRTKQ